MIPRFFISQHTKKFTKQYLIYSLYSITLSSTSYYLYCEYKKNNKYENNEFDIVNEFKKINEIPKLN